MRTGRARLIEWVRDIKLNVINLDEPVVTSEEWADRIMEDINLGIITAEVDG